MSSEEGGFGSFLCRYTGGVRGCVNDDGSSVVRRRASAVAVETVRGVCGREIPKAEGLRVRVEELDGDGMDDAEGEDAARLPKGVELRQG